MNTKFRIAAVIICVMIFLVSFTACDNGVGKSELLGAPKTAARVEYYELNTDGYKAFKNSVEAFASNFAAHSYSDYDNEDNFTVSPISVYMALALSVECSNGDTRQEILDALGVSYQQLQTHFSTLYRSLAVEHKAGDKTTGLLNLSNSIWVNKGTDVKQNCIDSLSNNFYAYSYSADFRNDNLQANKAVHDFVKKQTRGLIDQDFNLSKETLFALINTLYLKTIWNTDGEDLSLTEDKYDFTALDGSVKSVQLLQGDYVDGQAVEFETFTTFYTKTYDGYKIKFILPKDGYTVGQVFTAENIAQVNDITNYGGNDDSSDTRYSTRVLFPEYKCKYDKDIVKILKENFGIELLFTGACHFSTLTDKPSYCSKIQHVTDLTVDRKGIEGAAVTMMAVDESAAPILYVREDFVVDRSFGFIITDWQDITLFSGVVNNI